MFLVAQQMDMEQAVAVDVKGNDEVLLLLLDVLHILYLQRKRFFFEVDGLQGFSIIIKFDAGKERGMCLDGSFDGMTQAFSVEAAIQHIKVRKIVTGLADVLHTFDIDAILHSSQGC